VNEWLRTRLDSMPKRVYVRCVGGAEVVIGANAENATARNTPQKESTSSRKFPKRERK
jgi:hypothetical protein